MAESPVKSSYGNRTLSYCAECAKAYLAWRPERTSRHLPGFSARLGSGASILELGCGAGQDAAAKVSRGFVVDPTDGVPEIAVIAARNLGCPVRVLRFEEIDSVADYDAVWAYAALDHLPRAALPGTLTHSAGALKPGGFHFANF